MAATSGQSLPQQQQQPGTNQWGQTPQQQQAMATAADPAAGCTYCPQITLGIGIILGLIAIPLVVMFAIDPFGSISGVAFFPLFLGVFLTVSGAMCLCQRRRIEAMRAAGIPISPWAMRYAGYGFGPGVHMGPGYGPPPPGGYGPPPPGAYGHPGYGPPPPGGYGGPYGAQYGPPMAGAYGPPPPGGCAAPPPDGCYPSGQSPYPYGQYGEYGQPGSPPSYEMVNQHSNPCK